MGALDYPMCNIKGRLCKILNHIIQNAPPMFDPSEPVFFIRAYDGPLFSNGQLFSVFFALMSRAPTRFFQNQAYFFDFVEVANLIKAYNKIDDFELFSFYDFSRSHNAQIFFFFHKCFY